MYNLEIFVEARGHPKNITAGESSIQHTSNLLKRQTVYIAIKAQKRHSHSISNYNVSHTNRVSYRYELDRIYISNCFLGKFTKPRFIKKVINFISTTLNELVTKVK